MSPLERLPKKRVVPQIDLSDGQIVCGAPVGIELHEFRRIHRHFLPRTAGVFPP
jgi:hypothetical protein